MNTQANTEASQFLFQNFSHDLGDLNHFLKIVLKSGEGHLQPLFFVQCDSVIEMHEQSYLE